jgi:hypothetical protein
MVPLGFVPFQAAGGRRKPVQEGELRSSIAIDAAADETDTAI